MSDPVNQNYQSFLVRCWLVPPAALGETPAWRFELREVSAEPKKHRFSDLVQLKAFMAAKLATAAVGGRQDSEKESNRNGGEPSLTG